MKNVIISNPKRLEKKKRKFKEKGWSKMHILSDFDKTLTYAFTKGEKTQSTFVMLRNNNCLTPDYPQKSQALFDKYNPIEMNHKIPIEERKEKMNEWWKKHLDLLIESKLNENDIKILIGKGEITTRIGVSEFIDFSKKKNIPIIIMSAGLGDVIKLYLEKEKKLFNNIHIISNLFKWDSNGKAIRINPPIIHSANKDETTIKNISIYEELKIRRNVLLLGMGSETWR